MDPTRFEQVASELLELLDQQVATIAGRNSHDLSRDEAEAYDRRKRRILELRSALEELRPSK